MNSLGGEESPKPGQAPRTHRTSQDPREAPESGAPRPHFSVVIPLYNKAAYICQAVESVLAQRYGRLEVIVIDDGSIDGGADLLRKLNDPRLRVVCQANAGVSAARNLGIGMARGEWVVFLDADDWHHPELLASLVTVQQLHPQAQAIGVRYFDFTGLAPPAPPPLASPFRVEIIRDLAQRWMRGPAFFTSSVAIRISLLRRMQPCFPPGECFGEDLDLWFRIGEQTPVALLHRPLAGHRVQVAGSLSGRYRGTVPPFIERLRQRALSGRLTGRQSRSALWLAAQLKVDLARDAVVAGRRGEALGWLLQAGDAAGGARWWLTLTMALFWPGPVVARRVAAAMASP